MIKTQPNPFLVDTNSDFIDEYRQRIDQAICFCIVFEYRLIWSNILFIELAEMRANGDVDQKVYAYLGGNGLCCSKLVYNTWYVIAVVASTNRGLLTIVPPRVNEAYPWFPWYRGIYIYVCFYFGTPFWPVERYEAKRRPTCSSCTAAVTSGACAGRCTEATVWMACLRCVLYMALF